MASIGHNSESFKRAWYQAVWTHPHRDPALIGFCMLIHRYLAANGETVALSNQQIARELNISVSAAKRLKKRVLDLLLYQVAKPGNPITNQKSIIRPVIPDSNALATLGSKSTQGHKRPRVSSDPGLGSKLGPLKRKETEKKNPPTPQRGKHGEKPVRRKTYTPGFERWWSMYLATAKPLMANPGTKAEAFTAWQDLNAAERQMARWCLPDYERERRKEFEQEGKSWMRHGVRYLRHREWERFEPFWRREDMSADYLQQILAEAPLNGAWPDQLGPPPGHSLSVWTNHAGRLGLERFAVETDDDC